MDVELGTLMRRIDGPAAVNQDNILSWIVGDGIRGLEQRRDGNFQFWACSQHSSEDCECEELDSAYLLEISTAGWTE
ncbi:hypothetical protein [Nocardia jiangxiensis]|uniref:hypothetical protein n=1 Tax=Nocardia jiangxiensis TaxID=282685 RepID=UPI0012F69BD0|nr:hypothetical protein [Nocardia jiangxiensis]